MIELSLTSSRLTPDLGFCVLPAVVLALVVPAVLANIRAGEWSMLPAVCVVAAAVGSALSRLLVLQWSMCGLRYCAPHLTHCNASVWHAIQCAAFHPQANHLAAPTLATVCLLLCVLAADMQGGQEFLRRMVFKG